MSSDEYPSVRSRLGYLLKHAALRLAELHAEALAPSGIDGRELGVLLAIADGVQGSQQEVAERLGVDRTTMVAMLDALERKGIVSRHPLAEDRRRNVVELTDSGRATMEQAIVASDDAERLLLNGLDRRESAAFRQALTTIVSSGNPEA